ncbi:hypothetical protein ABPG74_013495 [Tetrahymena malaccensis]
MQQKPSMLSQNQTLSSKSNGQTQEENKSDYINSSISIQSQYQDNLKQLTEITSILNKQKQSRSKKWELIASVMNNLKEDEASNKYNNEYILDLEQNHSQHCFKDKTISRGSKSQNNSSQQLNSNLSDQTISKASSAQSKNASEQNLGNDNELCKEESSYITIHKKSQKDSNESSKIKEDIVSNNQSSNQIIQVESSKEILSNKKSQDYALLQKANSESIEIESEPSILSIGKLNQSSLSDENNSNNTQKQQVSSKIDSLSLSSKGSFTSSNQSYTSSNQSHTSSNQPQTSSNKSYTSSNQSQTLSNNSHASSNQSYTSSNIQQQSQEQSYISKDSSSSSDKLHIQSKEQINSTQQQFTSHKVPYKQIDQIEKEIQSQQKEMQTQNKLDNEINENIFQCEECEINEVKSEQNIDILIEDSYLEINDAKKVNIEKAIIAIDKSVELFAEYFTRNEIKLLSRQNKNKEVDLLENQIQTFKQQEQNDLTKQYIDFLDDQLKKKLIQDNQKDEDIILKNQSLIQQLKNQVRCTKKKYIERIFVAIYRHKYIIKKYLTSGGQADILIGTFLNEENKEKEYVFRIVSSDQDTYDYIKEEYELVKKFQKPSNIIKYYDSIYLEDIHTGVFIVEKCSGSLTGILQNKRNNQVNFTEQEIIHIVFDLVQGLIEMRSYNILHQDIKPDNILINKKGNYIYSDFGCSSKFLDGIAENKGFTMKYCAPEQLIEEYFSNYKADIYQLGRTIQQVLELYEKFGGAQTKFIKDLNIILLNNMLQDSQDSRKECIDILILLSDSIVESQQKTYAEKFILWIETQINQQQVTQEREAAFSLKSLVLFHFIWFQLKLFQGGYQLLIQKKTDEQLLNEIFEIIIQYDGDVSLKEPSSGNIQFSQNQALLLENLGSLIEIYNQQGDVEGIYKIASFLMMISEKINHQNKSLFFNAIHYLQIQSFEDVDLSKYQDQIEYFAVSQNDGDFYDILADQIFLKDINKAFYFQLKKYAQSYKKYIDYSQSQDLQRGDFFNLGFTYLQSLSSITEIFIQMNLDKYALNYFQFIRNASLHLKQERQFRRNFISQGQAFFNQKQYKKALIFFKEAYDQENNNLDNKIKSFNFYQSKFKIAQCYYELKEFEQAQKEFLEINELFENNVFLNKYHSNIVLHLKTISHIAAYFDQKGQFKKSIFYHSKLIQGLEDMNKKSDQIYQQLYSYSLFKLAMCYCQPESNDQNKSIHYFTQFLEFFKEKDICEIDLDQRQAILISQNSLAYFNFELKKYKNSVFYYTQLLKSLIQVSDYEDQFFQFGYNNLMVAMIQQKKTEDDFYHKFVDLIIEVVQGKHIKNDQQKQNIIKDIEQAYETTLELNEEEALLKNSQLISILENFNIKEEIYIIILNRQAQILFENAQYDQAIYLYENSLPIMNNLYSYPNQYVAIVLSSLAMSYHQIRKFEIAINYYYSALKTMKDLEYYEIEEKQQDMIVCIDRILMCFQGFGNTPLALEFYQSFQDLVPFLYEESHPSLIKFNTQYETCQKYLSQQN